MDVVDAATGLTGREKAVLRETMGLVMQDTKTHAIGLFVLLFTNHPGSKDYFKSFRGKEVSEIAGSPALRVHGTNVLKSVDEMVRSLDEADYLTELARKVGRNHLKRGITRPLFDVVGETIVAYLTSQLGDKMDAFTTAAWRKALCAVNDIAEQAQKEEEQH